MSQLLRSPVKLRGAAVKYDAVPVQLARSSEEQIAPMPELGAAPEFGRAATSQHFAAAVQLRAAASELESRDGGANCRADAATCVQLYTVRAPASQLPGCDVAAPSSGNVQKSCAVEHNELQP